MLKVIDNKIVAALIAASLTVATFAAFRMEAAQPEPVFTQSKYIQCAPMQACSIME